MVLSVQECKANENSQAAVEALVEQVQQLETSLAASSTVVDKLSSRVDTLKQALAETERKLDKSEEQCALAAAEASLAKDTTRKALVRTTDVVSSASFLAERSIRSPQKLFILIVWKNIFWIKVSKKYLIYFWKRKHWSCRLFLYCLKLFQNV